MEYVLEQLAVCESVLSALKEHSEKQQDSCNMITVIVVKAAV
ncbi:hypothetical protein [Thermodesulfovibrio thiophilus]|nr:hypothetical protein [Thermodesulfovibrio thiophilus]